MEIISIFEQLATTTHHSPDLSNLVSALPSNIKKLVEMNNFQELRKQMACSEHFPDSKTVAHE